MKKIIFVLLMGLGLLGAINGADARAINVRGYTKKNGTYVMPHYQTAPNKSKFDNFSTKGNFNPYTGKSGKVDPFKSKLVK